MAAKFGSNTGGAPLILPVYFKQLEPVYEVCKAAEKEIGTNLIDGAQFIRGLWRIYFSERSVNLLVIVYSSSREAYTYEDIMWGYMIEIHT